MAKPEKKTEETTAVARPVPPGISALIVKGDMGSKMVRRNAPPMVKPSDVPIGSAISGEIVAILESPVSTVKGKLLWLRHESGAEYTFPCTGVIRNALAPGCEAEKLEAALKKEIGKQFVAKRLDDKQSAKYKKAMFMFDVFTS